MAWVWWTLMLGVDVVGLVLAAFTLPGTWLILGATAVYAWLTKGEYVGWGSLLVLLGLALTAEVGEFVLGGAGAKRAGASKWGIAGGLLGAVLGGIFLTGLIPIPIVGTVIGICLGSFAGAFAVEMVLGKPVHHSFRIGFGAAKGRFLGILGKFTVGLAMFAIGAGVGLPVHFRGTPTRSIGTPPATSRVVTTTPTSR